MKDKKAFLLETHDKIAEKYDSDNKRKEFSNKYGKYRKALLSYAAGKTLEVGCGTGVNPIPKLPVSF